MREAVLFKKFHRTYKALHLKRSKMYTAVGLMLFSSVLEMSGLSILYPLVLAMGPEGSASLSRLPILSALSPNAQILTLFAIVALLYVVKNAVLYFTYEYNIGFAVYYYKNLVRGLYAAHLQKPVLEFQEESAGSLSNLICVQPERQVDGALRPFLVVVSELFLLSGISLLVLFINPWLMVSVIVTCGGSVGLYYAFLRTKAHAWGRRHMSANSAQQELVSNTAIGINEIKIFGKERYLTSKLAEIVQTKTHLFHHLEMYQQAPRFILESVFMLTVLGFFWAQLSMGTSPGVLLAQFSVVAAASFRILPSINRIVNSYSNFSYNIGPAMALLDTIEQSALFDGTHRIEPEQKVDTRALATNAIRLEKVSFRFPRAVAPVLENTSIEFVCGKRSALIGGSGSGKSTLIKLLAGLYTPTSGAVLVDGQDIALTPKAWQSSLGYVPQESFIMPGSIRENVVFGEGGAAGDETVWNALETVGFAAFVRALPDQLETKIGEKGIRLSGGQKQLMCLARALYRSPKVLLLDEPTASLDPQNEQIVLKAIEELPADTFIVMASHKHSNFRGFHSVFEFDASLRRFQERTPPVDKILDRGVPPVLEQMQ